MKSIPIGVAYVAAPLLLIAFAYPVIAKPESPWVLIAILGIFGLVCAMILHG